MVVARALPRGCLVWERKLYCVFVRVEEVISKLNILDVFNPAEERVVGYLTTIVGNTTVTSYMGPEDLRNFLRFVTGTSVLLAGPYHTHATSLLIY